MNPHEHRSTFEELNLPGEGASRVATTVPDLLLSCESLTDVGHDSRIRPNVTAPALFSAPLRLAHGSRGGAGAGQRGLESVLMR
jgi:hypothetical protein